MSHYKLKEEQVYMVQKLPNMEIHKYTRTLERTPLGNIQDRATNKFALETSKQEKNKSSSSTANQSCFKNASKTLSPIKFSKPKNFEPSLAESTRIGDTSTMSISRGQPSNSTTIVKKPSSCHTRSCCAKAVPAKKTNSSFSNNSCQKSICKLGQNMSKTRCPSTSRQSINSSKINQSVSKNKTSKNVSSTSLSKSISSNASSTTIGSNRSALSSSTFNCSSVSSTSEMSNKTIQNSFIFDPYTTLPPQNYVTISEDSSSSSKLFSPSSSFASANSTMFIQDKPRIIRTEPTTNPSKVVAPLKNTSNLNNTLQVNSEKQPAIKSSLKRRSTTNRQLVFPLLLCPDYLEDIISYNYVNRDQFLLDITWVDSCMDKRFRTFMVNWILELTQFALPDFEPALFMAVRLFDYAIMKLKLMKKSYQLAALVSMWLCVKYLGVNTKIRVPKLHMLGSGKYSKNEIVAMELSVLQSINFCFNVPDPLIFLHSYLITAKIEGDETLKYSTMFVMECTTLFEVFSVGDPALLAASALYFAYKVINDGKQTQLDINYRWYQLKDVQSYVSIMAQSVRTVIKYNFEPAKKYRTMEKLRVVEYFQGV